MKWYKVTREWIVKANDYHEAILKTKQFDHDCVHVIRHNGHEDITMENTKEFSDAFIELVMKQHYIINNILTDSQLDTRLDCGKTIREYNSLWKKDFLRIS